MGALPRGYEYPNEGFVQQAIEEYFLNLGYDLDTSQLSDLVCIKPGTTNRWVVEAKGKTSAIGLDFRTGLGQLVQRMTELSINYGLAVPDIPQFVAQYKQLQKWIRKSLNITILVVSDDGSVRVIEPDNDF